MVHRCFGFSDWILDVLQVNREYSFSIISSKRNSSSKFAQYVLRTYPMKNLYSTTSAFLKSIMTDLLTRCWESLTFASFSNRKGFSERTEHMKFTSETNIFWNETHSSWWLLLVLEESLTKIISSNSALIRKNLLQLFPSEWVGRLQHNLESELLHPSLIRRLFCSWTWWIPIIRNLISSSEKTPFIIVL